MNLPLRKSLITVIALLVGLNVGWAQSRNRKAGTQFTVTADPTVPRPDTTPCKIPLFTNLKFAFFSQTDQNFAFTPPAACPGPWQKVVLELDFSENPGIQFDRTASLYIANANLYFGTTPEPLQSVTNHWHIERDVTDYSALFATDQQGTMVLQNCTTDCPPPYNKTLNGVFKVSAQLQFYPVTDRSLRTPDMVLPLEQPNGSGGVSLPAILSTPAQQLTTAFDLPPNIERVYLDVVAQSQSTDEQWYACFPNNLSSINELYGCGNTDFRETEVSIDGVPAGIAPVSPWVFTGFLPDQWVPIPAVQTLDFVPYRVNLTPFAGVLSNGQVHTVALSVFNDDNYFSTAASLLLYLDPHSSEVTGRVTRNTLTLPSPTVKENLQGTSTVTGTIRVSEKRAYTIAGYLETAHGRIDTTVFQEQDFLGNQKIDFDTVNATVLDQKTSVSNSVNTLTTTVSRDGSLATYHTFSFPITVDLVYPVSSAEFGFTVKTTQDYQASKLALRNENIIEDFSSVMNSVSATDVSPASSWQHYVSFGWRQRPYDCEVFSEKNVLTKVSQGCDH